MSDLHPGLAPGVGLPGQLVLDAEALYQQLLRWVRGALAANTRLVGITSGGPGPGRPAWRDLVHHAPR